MMKSKIVIKDIVRTIVTCIYSNASYNRTLKLVSIKTHTATRTSTQK